MALNRAHLAEVWIKHTGGRWRVGTGYRVTQKFVMTACHIVHGQSSDAEAPVEARVRFLEGDGHFINVALTQWSDRATDTTLLELPASEITGEASSSASFDPRTSTWGEFDRTRTQEAETCGFPNATADEPSAMRDSRGFFGALDPHGRLKANRLLFDIKNAPDAGADLQGLSGAPVFVHHMLVGLVLAFRDNVGATTLEVQPVAPLLKNQQFRDLLGIPSPPKAPSAPEPVVAPAPGGGRNKASVAVAAGVAAGLAVVGIVLLMARCPPATVVASEPTSTHVPPPPPPPPPLPAPPPVPYCPIDDTEGASIADGRCPNGMRLVKGGTFLMGSVDSDEDADPHEKPRVRVTLKAFCLDRTEVTTTSYKELADRKCITPAGQGPGCIFGESSMQQYPINCVAWAQASTYCEKRGKRLPTEPEWEYAARSGARRWRFPWGSEPASESKKKLCWSGRGSSPKARSCPVGSFSFDTTADGITDMAGNLSEWVASDFCLYSDPDCRDSKKAIRGGDFECSADAWLRAAHRIPAEYQSSYLVGFRCAWPP